jgi:transmembrane sensor
MDTNIERRREDERNTIAEQAAAWLVELETGGAPEEEKFRQWIAESPLHIEAFLWASSVDTLLAGVDPERELEIELSSGPAGYANVTALTAPAPAITPSERRPGWRWQWAVAASLLVLLAGGWWARSSYIGWHSYSTAVGEQRSIRLEDGSKVYINTGSRLEVKVSAQARDVRLLAGEALFDVQRDPTRPFRVHSAATVIQAVGTQFNVYRHGANTTVSVLEGKVRLEGASSTTGMLAAGEQASVTAAGNVTKRPHLDTVRVTAWRQRRLVFADDTLADIAAEFNRYNETPKIFVEGAAVRALRLAAGFDADDPESLLQYLAQDPTLEMEIRPDALIIRGRNPAF